MKVPGSFWFRLASILLLVSCTQKSTIQNGLSNNSLSNGSTSVGSPTPVPTVQPTPQQTANPTPNPTPSATPQNGVPLPQSASQATFNHKQTVTVSGVNFGAKSNGGPVIWDDASGNNILDKWDGAWPNNSANASFNIAYHTPMRGISLPHNRISKYIAGAHGDPTLEGSDVIVFKNRKITSFPAYTYVSWYQRCDSGWVFGGDDNFKTFAFSSNTSPYGSAGTYWYIEYNPRPTSTTSTVNWHIEDSAGSNLTLLSPDIQNHSWWWDQAVNPMGGSWSKIEQEIKYTSQNDGYIKLWENGVLRINYVGSTDKYSGTDRTEGIGGYARQYGQPNNWRYYADTYLDYSRARIVLTNDSNYASATIIEPQTISQWSDTQITFNANLGRLPAGSTAYLFVFDNNGQRSTSSIAVKVGP